MHYGDSFRVSVRIYQTETGIQKERETESKEERKRQKKLKRDKKVVQK